MLKNTTNVLIVTAIVSFGNLFVQELDRTSLPIQSSNSPNHMLPIMAHPQNSTEKLST